MNKQTEKLLEVFKVQQDFTHSLILMYNEDRSIMGQFSIDKTMRKLMGNQMKIYIIGFHDDNTGKVEIVRKCTKEELREIKW